MRFALAAFAAIIALSPATAGAQRLDDIAVKVHGFRLRPTFAEVTYEVRNGSALRFDNVEASCTAYSADGSIVGTNAGFVHNLRPGEAGAGRVMIDADKTGLRSISKATCRIVGATR